MSWGRVVVCSSAIKGCSATQKATEKREKRNKPQNEPKYLKKKKNIFMNL